MKFSITKKVFDKFPNAKFGALFVQGINNSKSCSEIEQLLKDQIKNTVEKYADSNVKDISQIKSWRGVFKTLGLNRDFLPSHEALLRRVITKKELPTINPLVDIYNIISLKFLIPIGGHDTNEITEIRIDETSGKETFHVMNSDEIQNVKSGELAYLSDNKVLTRHFVWRQSDTSKTDKDTKSVFIPIDNAAGDMSTGEIKNIASELSELIKKFLGGSSEFGIVDKDNPEINFSEEIKVMAKNTKLESDKFNLISRNTEEVLTEEDLKALIDGGTKLKHYIGFEISGKIHLGTGIMCMSKVKDFLDAGVECNIFLADWHTWINDKLGGDMEKIQKFAVGYFKEGMKASLECVGGDPEKLKFTMGTDLYHNNDDYWATVIEVGKNTTLARILRSISIMGRKEGENIDFAKLIYPAMQVADIFIQGVNLPHAGTDQRKAHVVARSIAMNLEANPLIDKNGRKIKPVAVHHHLILGLGKPPMWPVPKENIHELWESLKMSKSKPDTCIFIHDSPDDIRRKINNAFCPECEVEYNPIIDWARHLIFREEKSTLFIKRDKKFGGDKTYKSFSEVEEDYKNKKLHPMDLKNGVCEKVIELLEPARKHFEKPRIKEMLSEMEKMTVTR